MEFSQVFSQTDPDHLFELAKHVTQPLDSCFKAVFLITSYERDNESLDQCCDAGTQRASVS